MNLSKALTYMFEDEKWSSKGLLAVVIAMIPVLNFAWVGYSLDVLRNVTEGNDALPEWDDIGGKFVDGLKLILARLVYLIPVFILLFFPTILLLIPLAASRNGNGAALLWVIFGLIFFFFFCIAMLYCLAVSIISPAITIHYSHAKTFGSCFHFKEIFHVMGNDFGMFMLAWVGAIVVGILTSIIINTLGMFLGWIPCLGGIASIFVTLAASVWSALVANHLFGQVAARVYSKE
jgi:hypothetical protein